MSEENVISVDIRDGLGKGAARAARRQGLVPGIVYGGSREPQAISVTRKQLDRLLATGVFFNTLYELKADGKAQRVLPRDVQYNVVTDVPIHVDFMRVAADAEIVIEVPVLFLNEEDCDGLRRGGVLNVVRHDIEVRCRADAIPENIEADLAGLDIGDSVHISAIKLPDGVAPTITDRDFTIATIAAPSVAPAEEEEAAEEEAEEGAVAPEEAGEAEPEAKEGGEE